MKVHLAFFTFLYEKKTIVFHVKNITWFVVNVFHSHNSDKKNMGSKDPKATDIRNSNTFPNRLVSFRILEGFEA